MHEGGEWSGEAESRSGEGGGKKGGEVVLDLKELEQSGVDIDIVTSNKGPTNNNDEKHENEESRTEKNVDDVKEEGKCEEEGDVTADESGFQEANSSQLEQPAASPPGKVLRAQDLNKGFRGHQPRAWHSSRDPKRLVSTW